ncbi:unnamed protein product [Adineta ricciae]|uniref:Uncharacterized protein n=1 Tax=Adineta ricciae TaxID=249248 RepID=A0A816D279_ADIRI|nr:unnamed protein product [Adineta ricciae]CAF1629143.1 unnamed protein product [Adineta ricciae]
MKTTNTASIATPLFTLKFYFAAKTHSPACAGLSDPTACELVRVSHDMKHAFEQSGGDEKSFTTNLVCSNTSREILPSFVIYSAKQLNSDWAFGGPFDSYYGVSGSGWIKLHVLFKFSNNICASSSASVFKQFENFIKDK